MNRKQVKLIVLGAGILLCVAFLLVVGNQPGGMVYYLTVSEFMQAEESHSGGFRISGKVEIDSVDRDPGGRAVTFVITDGEAALPVRYQGPIPDAFAENVDVVVQGGLAEDRTFEAHTLIAKCPSKYEAADGHPDEIPIGN